MTGREQNAPSSAARGVPSDEEMDNLEHCVSVPYHNKIRIILVDDRARSRRQSGGLVDNTHSRQASRSRSPSTAELAENTPETNTPDEKKTKPELVFIDEKDVGKNANLKHLYSGKEDRHGRFQWTTTIPKDLGRPAEDADSARHAILVRHVKVYGDPRRVLRLHSIVVQSPYLKALLEHTLKDYPGVSILERLEFSGSFEPLIHRWTEILAYIAKLEKVAEEQEGVSQKEDHEKPKKATENTSTATVADRTAQDAEAEVQRKPKAEESQGGEGKGIDEPAVDEEQSEISPDPAAERAEELEHCALFKNLLEKEFKDLLAEVEEMWSSGVVSYENLWTAFPPGSFVYTQVQGQDRIFRLENCQYGRDINSNPVLWLSSQYVDTNGSRFGTTKMNFKIPKYEGTKPFSDLAVLPLDQHTDKTTLVAKLIERGGCVEGLSGAHYRAYNGIGWCRDHEGRTESHTIKGRIMVDPVGWNRFNPGQAVYVSPLLAKVTSRPAAGFGGDNDGMNDEFGWGGGFPGNAQAEADLDSGIPFDGVFHDENEEDTRPKLTDEHKMLCIPTVRGYALKEKIWLNFFVNAITDVAFNAKAFEALVLPANQKELILGFTSTQQDDRNSFDDVIEGKGRGIILLLCGPPGVGKTLTAESVAEEMKVPLYMLSSGDLGIDPRHVEAKLNGILSMCTRWNAILLIDEADVFLEERSLHELERNKLVSVFLRILEYYEGIMFLTTNRVQSFDPAFHSRIHISIDYPELSIQSRRTVWVNFLKQHNGAQAAARAKAPKPVEGADEEEVQKRHKERTQDHEIYDSDLHSLSLMSMNGRQIKNILKTAQLLASQRQQPLRKEHVTVVMGVTQHLHNATKEKESTRRSFFS